MTTEQKIRDAFINYDKATGPIEFMCFRAGYLALLKDLELGDWARDSDNAPLYALPEGVEKP